MISSKKVLLTGSSGNLGTYLLAELLRAGDVDRIWCLNRSAGVEHRQAQILDDRGLPSHLFSVVQFHQSNFNKEHLGLPQDVYDTIANEVTHILHCAWPVDWNKSFASFEPSIRGLKNLIDLTAISASKPILFFISSVAAAGNWGAIPGARLAVPEEEVEDWKVARFGYGQSKLVAERLLTEATHTAGITTAVCRVGQVAGPVERGTAGVWPPQEWLPSLIASSKHLGIIPGSLGPAENVDWVPVDYLNRIVVELLFHGQASETIEFHHIRNPNIVTWHDLFPTIRDVLERDGVKGTQLDVKDLATWVHALEKSAEAESGDLSNNPAVKLLSFFQELNDKARHLPKARAVTLEVKNSIKKSPTLANLEHVNREWMALWMQQWQLQSVS